MSVRGSGTHGAGLYERFWRPSAMLLGHGSTLFPQGRKWVTKAAEEEWDLGCDLLSDTSWIRASPSLLAPRPRSPSGRLVSVRHRNPASVLLESQTQCNNYVTSPRRTVKTERSITNINAKDTTARAPVCIRSGAIGQTGCFNYCEDRLFSSEHR